MSRCVCSHLLDFHAEDGTCQVCGVVTCPKYRQCSHAHVDLQDSMFFPGETDAVCVTCGERLPTPPEAA